MLGKLSADVSLKYFFLFSPEMGFDSSFKLPLFDTICMKLQFYFFFEKKQTKNNNNNNKKQQQQQKNNNKQTTKNNNNNKQTKNKNRKKTTTKNKKKNNKKKQQKKTTKKLSRLLNAQIVVRVNKSIRLGVNVHVILDISDKKSYKKLFCVGCIKLPLPGVTSASVCDVVCIYIYFKIYSVTHPKSLRIFCEI